MHGRDKELGMDREKLRNELELSDGEGRLNGQMGISTQKKSKFTDSRQFDDYEH